MDFEPDYCRVEADPRAPGHVYWMFESQEVRPFGHLEVTTLGPSQWGVKVVLARLDLGPDDLLPVVARALVQAMNCTAEVVDVWFAHSGARHQLVNVGSRFV